MAGLSGESGKTLVSIAVLLEAARAGMPVRAFKKGPDYIDAAWLSWASRSVARNLDSWMMGLGRARESFVSNAVHGGFNLVEGNRGLFDGVDAKGSHSTAELAKSLFAPVVLVLNATKVTRTVAALVLGCQRLDAELWIGGVILNQVSGSRHERILRDSIESACGVPVLGAIPRAASGTPLPTRHLGLVTPSEHPELETLRAEVLKLVAGRMDLARLFEMSERAPRMASPSQPSGRTERGSPVRVGYIRDSAFTFYYPENLEALEAAGAELIPMSSLSAVCLPEELDALYIGGGFPETHARALAANTSLLKSIRHAAAEGMPIYAECGGLMLLARGLLWRGIRYPMADALPFEVEVRDTPQGHGYTELLVDTPNPYFAVGTRIKGHEFHYSRLVPGMFTPPTACAVLRGSGCQPGRDGVTIGNVWAGYTHLHALAVPEWARGFLAAARRFVPARV